MRGALLDLLGREYGGWTHSELLSIANGAIIDRMAGDRDGIAPWKCCITTHILRQLCIPINFFHAIFAACNLDVFKRALKTSNLYKVETIISYENFST